MGTRWERVSVDGLCRRGPRDRDGSDLASAESAARPNFVLRHAVSQVRCSRERWRRHAGSKAFRSPSARVLERHAGKGVARSSHDRDLSNLAGLSPISRAVLSDRRLPRDEDRRFAVVPAM